MYKLLVWNTIGETYRFIWSERGAWLNHILGPMLLLGLLSAALPLLGFDALTPQSPEDFPENMPIKSFLVSFAVVALLFIAIYITFVVAWHRRYLLGPENTSARELITWERRHWVLIGRAIQLVFFMFLVFIVVALVAGLPVGLIVKFPIGSGVDGTTIFEIIGLIVGGWTISLFVSVWMIGTWLMFPAAAVEDRGFGIRKSMSLARSNRWRMFAIFLVGSVWPMFAVQIVLSGITIGIVFVVFASAGGLPDIPFAVELLMGIVSVAFYFLAVAIGVSMLSLIYRRLRDNVPLDEPEAA